jgi:hypothetical protein
MIDYILNREEKKVNGWFINFFITIVYLAVIIWSFFDAHVAKRLMEISPFMTWFFVTSFGIWATKSAIENMKSGSSAEK